MCLERKLIDIVLIEAGSQIQSGRSFSQTQLILEDSLKDDPSMLKISLAGKQ